MGTPASAAPDRDAVAGQWRRVIAGETTREEAHAWARPWVEERDGEVDDPVVRSALLHLHGVDLVRAEPGGTSLRHGGRGTYVHSAEALQEAFDRWQAKARGSAR